MSHQSCPYDGHPGKPQERGYKEHGIVPRLIIWIECSNCGAKGPEAFGYKRDRNKLIEEAWARWDTRPTEELEPVEDKDLHWAMNYLADYNDKGLSHICLDVPNILRRALKRRDALIMELEAENATLCDEDGRRRIEFRERRCECSENDACAFARERDEAIKENKELKERLKGESS